MALPQMPNMPGAAAMTDTLDFVKNLWGSMNVPGMGIPGITAPTLSVEELDKKINDLKAVEAWLNLNISMLRGSIQALEVQRGTIATLKSMGATLAAAIEQPGATEKSLFESVPYASAFFQQPQAAAPAPAAPAPAPPTPQPAAAAQPADAAAHMANPGVWWNMLQDQFQQAVTTAMSSDTAGATKAEAKAATAKAPKAPAKRAPVKKPAAKRA